MILKVIVSGSYLNQISKYRNFSYLISVVTLISVCSSYTLKQGQRVTFPTQREILNDGSSFERVDANNRSVILTCPNGFIFNSEELKCKIVKHEDFDDVILDICLLDESGVFPDPMNCRNFISCQLGKDNLQLCDAHLLFNSDKRQCDWPEESNCCEYIENMSFFEYDLDIIMN